MDDQTKSIQTLSIEGSIEYRKHNQLDIKYLHQLFIRNPQLGCLASHYRRKPNNNNKLTKPRYLCKRVSFCCLQSSIPEIGTVVCSGICANHLLTLILHKTGFI